MRLNSEVALLPLGNLHLRTRAVNKLQKVRITTIGDFLNRTEIGAEEPWRVGPTTWVEIKEARSALWSAITDGKVNWLTYAQIRGFDIFPSEFVKHWSGRQFMTRFPTVARCAVESRFGRAGLVVLEERLLKPSNARQTMDQVGLVLGVMWETVRRIEIDIVSMFRRILIESDYSCCLFRFRSEFLSPLLSLSTAFTQDKLRIQSFADCQETFKRVWAVTLNDLGGQENLLMDILGFRWLHRKPQHNRSRRAQIGVERMRAVRKEIRKALAQPGSARISLRVLVGLMKSKFGKDAPSSKEVGAIIRKMPRGSVRPTVRGRPAERPAADWVTNTCERLLRRRRKPLHFSDLCAGVNRVGCLCPRLSPKLVAVYLYRDARFVPIGWSGLWALAEWPQVETRKITDVAEAILIDAEHPLTDEALFDRISQRRPVGRKSVTVLLNGDERFRRIPGGRWTLASRGPRGRRRHMAR
jgi:hypothetical protein